MNLEDIKQNLKKEKATILPVDKGTGLVIITKKTLNRIYNAYTQDKQQISPWQAIILTRKLREALLLYNPELQTLQEDDRTPTFYFKVKIHKDTFPAVEHYELTNIFTFSSDPITLLPFFRPVVNHASSLTSLSSSIITPMLQPIIRQQPYHHKDAKDALNSLFEYGPPLKLYAQDVKDFYPSTPHSLIEAALDFFIPQNESLNNLIEKTLNMNFITDGEKIYHLGPTGIPQGLSCSPELAQLATAYLLRNYIPPPMEKFSVYFDDLTATFPIPQELLTPYLLKEAPDNFLQDIQYLPESKTLIPYKSKERNPVPLHYHSYHPHDLQNIPTGYAFRLATQTTHPHKTLNNLLSYYLPLLNRASYPLKHAIEIMTTTAYFPIIKHSTTNQQQEEPYTAILTSWSQTRPTYSQLAPLIINKPIKLIYTIPLAPLKALISYSKPPVGHPYIPDVDHDDICRICDHYNPTVHSKINTPIIPCATYRMIYALRHPDHPTVMYVGQAGATRRNILQRPHLHRIAQHLNKNNQLTWEILQLIPAHFRTPSKTITTLETKWAERLRSGYYFNNNNNSSIQQIFTIQEPFYETISQPPNEEPDNTPDVTINTTITTDLEYTSSENSNDHL
ncbi:hypothetical protein LOD99_10237 [Oopsacas minuta]|uniref:Reverse transcriptase domain-containing protein n=1 Tax=Oopsacas minuta TaxID=111878 RepID=A0AAV7KKB7_9METZ|nr:hypothetical protein LOD99_10237 [Oopsacas minuta]